jgi:hypothetical protein
VLRLEPGTYVFALGNLDNFRPSSRKVTVRDTSVLEPLEVAFYRKDHA